MSELCPALPMEKHFSVGRALGQGRYGTVYLATHLLTGEPLAVKAMRGSRASLRRVSRELLLQCRAQRRCRHVVQALPCRVTCCRDSDGEDLRGAGGEQGAVSAPRPERRFLLLQEFAPLGDLFAQLPLNHGLPEWACRTVAQHVGRALHHLHARCRLVHGDVRPENVMLFPARGDEWRPTDAWHSSDRCGPSITRSSSLTTCSLPLTTCRPSLTACSQPLATWQPPAACQSSATCSRPLTTCSSSATCSQPLSACASPSRSGEPWRLLPPGLRGGFVCKLGDFGQAAAVGATEGRMRASPGNPYAAPETRDSEQEEREDREERESERISSGFAHDQTQNRSQNHTETHAPSQTENQVQNQSESRTQNESQNVSREHTPKQTRHHTRPPTQSKVQNHSQNQTQNRGQNREDNRADPQTRKHAHDRSQSRPRSTIDTDGAPATRPHINHVAMTSAMTPAMTPATTSGTPPAVRPERAVVVVRRRVVVVRIGGATVSALPSADAFSLGVLLFCALTGCFPWRRALPCDPHYAELRAHRRGGGGRRSGDCQGGASHGGNCQGGGHRGGDCCQSGDCQARDMHGKDYHGGASQGGVPHGEFHRTELESRGPADHALKPPRPWLRDDNNNDDDDDDDDTCPGPSQWSRFTSSGLRALCLLLRHDPAERSSVRDFLLSQGLGDPDGGGDRDGGGGAEGRGRASQQRQASGKQSFSPGRDSYDGRDVSGRRFSSDGGSSEVQEVSGRTRFSPGGLARSSSLVQEVSGRTRYQPGSSAVGRSPEARSPRGGGGRDRATSSEDGGLPGGLSALGGWPPGPGGGALAAVASHLARLYPGAMISDAEMERPPPGSDSEEEEQEAEEGDGDVARNHDSDMCLPVSPRDSSAAPALPQSIRQYVPQAVQKSVPQMVAQAAQQTAPQAAPPMDSRVAERSRPRLLRPNSRTISAEEESDVATWFLRR